LFVKDGVLGGWLLHSLLYFGHKLKMNKEQLDLLFEYIESRLHMFVKGLPPDIRLGLRENEKEIKEKLYKEVLQ
jgi:hypothetical protein